MTRKQLPILHPNKSSKVIKENIKLSEGCTWRHNGKTSRKKKGLIRSDLVTSITRGFSSILHYAVDPMLPPLRNPFHPREIFILADYVRTDY